MHAAQRLTPGCATPDQNAVAKRHSSFTHCNTTSQQQQQRTTRCNRTVCQALRTVNNQQEPSIETASVTLQQRRGVLLGCVAAGSACQLLLPTTIPPAAASVTVTIRPKAELKPYTLKAGYSLVVPDSWSLAYDRSADEKSGTQAFFGNFRTFETLSISRLEKPEGGLSPEQLLDWVLADQRNNQSTYEYELLSGNTPAQRAAPTAGLVEGVPAAEDVYYDSEYMLAICRGLIQEGSGGSKRCIGPRDMDLEVVSRTFFQTFTVRKDNIYIIRGSSTTAQWPAVRAAAEEAVHSFRLPAAMQ